MNRTAAVISGIYFAITATIAVRTSLDPSPGFGSLKHIFTFLATSPVSVPLALLGWEPDFNHRWVVAVMVFGATAAIYGIVSGIGWILGRYW